MSKRQESVKKPAELYKILPKGLKKEYTFGIHGFDDRYWERDSSGKPSLNKEQIEKSQKEILEAGLSFEKNRSLLSTVRFSDLDSYIETEGYYDAGGIIVALPSILRSEDGREMFIGSPNEDIEEYANWDRNHQQATLCDAALPEDGKLDSMFILGSYSKTSEGIQINLNEEHLAFNGGVVSSKFYDAVQERISKLKELDNTVPFDETSKQQKEYERKCHLSLRKSIISIKDVVANAIKSGITREDVDNIVAHKDKEDIQKD